MTQHKIKNTFVVYTNKKGLGMMEWIIKLQWEYMYTIQGIKILQDEIANLYSKMLSVYKSTYGRIQ